MGKFRKAGMIKLVLTGTRPPCTRLQSSAKSNPRSGNTNRGALKEVLLVDVALLMTFKVFLNLPSTTKRLGAGVLDMANPFQACWSLAYG